MDWKKVIEKTGEKNNSRKNWDNQKEAHCNFCIWTQNTNSSSICLNPETNVLQVFPVDQWVFFIYRKGKIIENEYKIKLKSPNKFSIGVYGIPRMSEIWERFIPI